MRQLLGRSAAFITQCLWAVGRGIAIVPALISPSGKRYYVQLDKAARSLEGVSRQLCVLVKEPDPDKRPDLIEQFKDAYRTLKRSVKAVLNETRTGLDAPFDKQRLAHICTQIKEIGGLMDEAVETIDLKLPTLPVEISDFADQIGRATELLVGDIQHLPALLKNREAATLSEEAIDEIKTAGRRIYRTSVREWYAKRSTVTAPEVLELITLITLMGQLRRSLGLIERLSDYVAVTVIHHS